MTFKEFVKDAHSQVESFEMMRLRNKANALKTGLKTYQKKNGGINF